MNPDEIIEESFQVSNRLTKAVRTIGNPFSQAGLEATEAYSTGALRFIQEGSGLGVENIVTGQKFFSSDSSVEQILASVLDLKISEFTQIVEPNRASLIAGDAVSQAEFGRLADLVKSINDNILSGDDVFATEARAAAGLSDDFKGQKIIIERFGFLTGSEAESGIQGAVDTIAKNMLDRNQFMQSSEELREQAARLAGVDIDDAKVIPGIVNIQKDAAILLRAKVGDKYLTESQLQSILVRMGSQVLDSRNLKKDFR